MRSAYGFERPEIVKALGSFAGLPRVTLEDPARALNALRWFSGGMDFADALHLAKAESCEAFVSLTSNSRLWRSGSAAWRSGRRNPRIHAEAASATPASNS